MKILSTYVKTREYDKKLMVMGLTPDYDSTYYYLDGNGYRASYTPTKWIILKVYDWEAELVA
jgi:hypothetical protein